VPGTLPEIGLSPDTVLRLAPNFRTRLDAAGHVVVDSPAGTVVDIGPRGFAILSMFSRPLRLGDALERLAGLDGFALEDLGLKVEVHHHEGVEEVAALTTVADSLPGLGIVAAVLGVVITMGALGGKPEEIGHKVAAALVGTFLGILMCYGLIGPLASNMAKTHEAERAYYQMLRVAMSAFNKGIPPLLAVEVGRRSIPSHMRPSFQEVEKTCRHRGAAAQPEAA